MLKIGDKMRARKLVLCGSIMLPTLLCAVEENFTILDNLDLLSAIKMEKIGYLFAHGLGATQEQSSLFLPTSIKKWLINKPAVLFDFPDSKSNNMEYYNAKVNLGQELDIQRFDTIFHKAITRLTDYKFILSGISRGAATIINYVALNHPEQISALVLESPFDTLINIIKHLLRRFHVSWIPFSKKIAFKIAKKHFPLLNPNGIFPIKVINRIPSTLPILFIHSRNDRTIPINSSRNLYKSLIQAGHHNAYIFELASGDHGKLMLGDESELYKNVVHAFYKRYHLPHDPFSAQLGEPMLKYCQPTLDEINKRIRRNRSSDDLIFENDIDDMYEELTQFDEEIMNIQLEDLFKRENLLVKNSPALELKILI